MNKLYEELNRIMNIKYHNTFTEKINEENCDYLLSLSDETLENEIFDPNELIDESGQKFNKTNYCKYVKKILRQFKKNNYKLSRKYHQNNNMGRLYVVDGGVQSFQNKIKGFLMCDDIYDYDMINAHPNILCYICNIYYPEIPINYLKEYCDSRDNVLKNNNINKLDIIICMNTSNNKLKIDNIWLKSFHNEIINIQNKIYDDVREIIPTDKKYNIKGSVINKLLCIFENYLLYLVCDYSINNNIYPDSAIFDGLHIKNSNLVDEFNEITKRFNIKWKIKPFNKTLIINKDLINKELSNYIERKEIFEEKYFMTKRPIRFYEKYTKNKLSYIYDYKKDDFTLLVSPFTFTQYEEGEEKIKSIFSYWINDENRLCYDDIEFLPPPFVKNENIFNSFPGFNYYHFEDYVNIEGDVKQFDDNTNFTFIQDHIRYLCGSEMTEELFNYMEQYIGNVLFEPGKLSRISILIKSTQGTGKNLFFETFFKNLLYDDAVLSSSNADDFFGKFSDTEKVFIGLFDEASGKDTFQITNFMKTAISNDIKRLEKKGKNTIQVKNYSRYIIFTNGENPVQIELGDRRHVAIECDNKMIEINYINKLLKVLNNTYILKSYINYLKSIYNPDYDWITNRPLTSYYKQLQSINISQYELFITDLIYKEKKSSLEFKGLDFYNKYIEYMKGKDFKPSTNTAFGRYMMKFKGISKIKNCSIKYVINVGDVITELNIDEDTKKEYKLLCDIN